MSKNMRN